ncbi:hypothetical protein [Nocardia arthritidis]|uniref:YbaB/EbfC family DNA-binding protein n=1 Tax=Nocardia arthritidis TaxID=228602 RepID=A0A6G9Y7F3_9NOCA|nr:hypothetical protein [Nocardia arthritidis]QIS09185.1 hypothetical protein F5544_06370 [Nocardia arthritidis]
MNRDWNRKIQNIRDGQPELAQWLHQVTVRDPQLATEFGTVTIDGLGTLRSIDLDPHKVSDVYEADVVAAVVTAVNTALEDVRSADTKGVRP